MRLKQNEIAAILSFAREQDPNAIVYLYGSRVDDSKKGGDVDLLIVSEMNFNINRFLAKLKAEIGDQKIDVQVQSETELDSSPFLRKIMAEAVELKSDC